MGGALLAADNHSKIGNLAGRNLRQHAL